MLSVVTFYSESGHDHVMHALDTYQRFKSEPRRFYTIVQFFQSPRCPRDLRVSLLTFMNMCVNSGAELETRVSARNDLLALVRAFTSLLVIIFLLVFFFCLCFSFFF